MKNIYRDIIKAQLHGFSKYSPIADGDFAIVLENPEKGFKERDVVKIEKVVGEFAFVKKFKRSKQGWVHVNNLEKIKMVSASSDASDDSQMIPIRVEEVTTLKELNPKLFLYFGKRIKEIFSEKMVDKDELGNLIPKLNPKIVIGEFLSGMQNTEGFVSKWGTDTGVIYVNINAHFPIDEVVAHEFSHILSFYSKELSEKLNDPSIQLGLEDEEMDESQVVEQGKKEQEEMAGMDEQLAAKKHSENYFLKPTEVFAHTEQMRYLADKFKQLDLKHVQLDNSLTPQQKQKASQEIFQRPITYYKRQVMGRLVPYFADKYKIKDYTARKIYESLFDNIESYVPNVPKQGAR